MSYIEFVGTWQLQFINNQSSTGTLIYTDTAHFTNSYRTVNNELNTVYGTYQIDHQKQLLIHNVSDSNDTNETLLQLSYKIDESTGTLSVTDNKQQVYVYHRAKPVKQPIDVYHKYTNTVVTEYGRIDDVRIRTLVQSFAQHLHEFILQNHVSSAEYKDLTVLAQLLSRNPNPMFNEWEILIDVMGGSQLIEMAHDADRLRIGLSANSLTGPIYRANAPEQKNGDNIFKAGSPGTPVKLYGRVVSADGKPVSNATLDIWEADGAGNYDIMTESHGSDYNGRGQFKTDEQGNYCLVAMKPVPYSVPIDGNVGKLLQLRKRKPLRPAHIHVIVHAPNYETLIIQLYDKNDITLNEDITFSSNATDMLLDFTGNEVKQDFVLLPGTSVIPPPTIPF